MSLSIKDFTIGLDPEFFLFKDGKPISAHDIVPGTKLEPHKLKHCSVQADGTAVEFNTKPASTKKQFIDSIDKALKDIRKLVPKEYEFKFIPSVDYEKEYFEKLPNFAKELGCSPDFNAYSWGAVNRKPNNNTTLRSAGGHIHIGWPGEHDIKSPGHIYDACVLVKNLDPWFQSFNHVWDKDYKRQNLYGAPGAMRPKPYGVEHRSLSNAWLAYPELWPWIYDSIIACIDKTIKGTTINRVSFATTVYQSYKTDPSKEYPETKFYKYADRRNSYVWEGYIPIPIEELIVSINKQIDMTNKGMPHFPTEFKGVSHG